MTTYAEQVKPYINFKSRDEMDQHFNLFRNKHRYEITKGENEALFALNGFAYKHLGACKVELEKVAKAAGVSLTTVKNAVSKAVKFGMLKRYRTRKERGRRQGVTVYQFQHFLPQDCPQTSGYREESAEVNSSKVEIDFFESYSPILLLPSLKNTKDTSITEQAHSSEKSAVKQKTLKDALLDKLPNAIRGISLYFDDSQKLHDLAGIVFAAKDKSIKIEEHENLFRKTIRDVYEYWQRQISKGKVDYNVFGLMRKAIKDLVAKIKDGSAYQKAPVRTAAPKRFVEAVPDWMPVRDIPADIVPDWIKRTPEEKAAIEEERKKAQAHIDFEAERRKVLERLNQLQG